MNYEFLSRTFLFQGTSPEETKHMLSCLKATPQSYAKGSTIWQVGDQVKMMGLVLNGSVHIENIDMMGNKSILNRIAPGQVFGETYACIPGEKLLIGVTAAEDCQILFLEVGKIFRTCPDTCPCHEKLIRNMLMVMAKKNLELSRRSLHTAPKSIRGRLLSYFSQEMVQQGVVGRIAGFNVFESNNMDYESTTRVSSKKTTTEFIAGHPNWCHRVMEWQTAVHLQDLSGSGKYIGASAVQGRKVYGLKVSKPQTLYIKRTETAA